MIVLVRGLPVDAASASRWFTPGAPLAADDATPQPATLDEAFSGALATLGGGPVFVGEGGG